MLSPVLQLTMIICAFAALIQGTKHGNAAIDEGGYTERSAFYDHSKLATAHFRSAVLYRTVAGTILFILFLTGFVG
jgi:hypothetical protein